MDKQKDHLEDFVRSNRSGFDTNEPSKKVWKDIERQLPYNDNASNWGVWLWRAAAVIFFCSTVYLWVTKDVVESNKQDTVAVAQDVEDFGRVEEFYFSQISEKESQIVNYQNKIEVEGNYEVDLQKLDAMYDVLKGELKKDPTNHEVKDALTLNLLVRIDLLNEQLKAIEDSNPKVKAHLKGV